MSTLVLKSRKFFRALKTCVLMGLSLFFALILTDPVQAEFEICTDMECQKAILSSLQLQLKDVNRHARDSKDKVFAYHLSCKSKWQGRDAVYIVYGTTTHKGVIHRAVSTLEIQANRRGGGCDSQITSNFFDENLEPVR